MILKNSEKKENNKLKFTVESDAAELIEAIRKVYLRNRKQMGTRLRHREQTPCLMGMRPKNRMR